MAIVGNLYYLRPDRKRKQKGRARAPNREPLTEQLSDACRAMGIRERLREQISTLAQAPQFRAQSEVTEDFRLSVVRAAIAIYLLDKLDGALSNKEDVPPEASRASAEIIAFLGDGFFEMGADEIREGFLDLRKSLATHSRKLKLALVPPDLAVKICLPRLSKEIDAINGISQDP